MQQYIIKRILLMIPVIFGVTLLLFTLIRIVPGDVVDVMPAYSEHALRVEFFGDEVEALTEFDPLTGETRRTLDQFDLYPANQYVTTRGKLEPAIAGIKAELEERVAFFEKQQKYLEAQRIRMRTSYD